MIRFQIILDEGTFLALRNLADMEFRDVRQQAGFVIREALETRGFKTDKTKCSNRREKELITE